ncbi:MAG: response regulator [Acidobacteria bacterium]|nr:response regulator [Acidobacteriota bacterium]
MFISYSHKDDAEKENLLAHLGVLKPGLINLWSDDALGAGDDWEHQITEAIGQAKVAMLLITANFLNSDFILREEVPRLLTRREKDGLVVFPVIAKYCAWSRIKWLKGMQVRPKYGEPVWRQQGAYVDQELARIAEEVADIVARAGADSPAAVRVPTTHKVRVTEHHGASKILILDDDPLFRSEVIDIFSDTDVAFVEADSVEEAKRVLDEDREVRIILLDLQLPGENGTAILEHIMGRAAEYRVIVLTAYNVLLPAAEAKVYKVFQYLSKSAMGQMVQSLRFAVEQARQDIERERLARANQEDRFDEVILNKYPTPFTYIYQELKSDMLTIDVLHRQSDIFKLLLNFTAVALMCEYFGAGPRDARLDARIHNSVFEPDVTDWLNIIGEITGREDEPQAAPFRHRLAAFLNEENRGTIRTLVEMLDRFPGYGVKRSEFEYQEVARECEKLLIPLLQEYQFITGFLLCYVSSVKKVGGEYSYRLQECTGANPQLLFSRKTFNFLMNSDELHLINREDGQFYSLHPFIILERCAVCTQLEIFFYVAFADGQLHYTSYRTGHTRSTEVGVKEFRSLLRIS